MSEQAKKQTCCKDVFQRILVAIDDSEPGRWALRMAERMAATGDSFIALVHVVSGDVGVTPEFALLQKDLAEDKRKAGEDLLLRAASGMAASRRPKLMLKEGEPSQQIIVAAKEFDADIIVVGTHGRGVVAHMLLGSTAESVVRHAHAPVLTVGCDPCKHERSHSAHIEETSRPSSAQQPGELLETSSTAMQRADKNIDELLEHLNGTFHRVRQSGIDEELFDVVSGFEALSVVEK